ncbi:hypothetical protein PsorP6_000467 [Peronosclerospora sorghi]|uniref:Uncharacterized protein n=1 Tax=Peronosclerospora sorghi TaxID=230839 RepID=A0ACC0WV89_9STRA|nr:hypothetical protein PsorP6_000467 [Peronosclerospora sorghi]
MGVELRAENENANPTNRVKGNMNPPSMRPKCALDEPPTSPVASLKRERSSSWHLDAHVASSAAARGRVDVKIDGRRTGDAIKTRRLSETHKESCAQVDDRLLYLLSGSVTPGRRVFRRDVGVVTTAVPDSKAIRNQELKSAIMQKREIEEEKVPCALQDSEGPFVISPHRRQNEMSGRQRSVFGGDERQDKITSTAPLNASMSALPAMQKVSPFMHQRVPAGSPDMSPIRNQELKSPIKQKREIEEEKVPSNPALPSLLPSLEASGQEKVNGDDSDVSRDVSEFEVAYSQEKLDDLSIKECDMTEAVVLSLCGKLAKSLSKAERDRMEQANLLTIPLAEEQSPIVLGRDQFQDVFGDNIHGGMISHLSRRHCLIRVHNVPSRDDSARESIKVMIEDTSTNGIRVNDTQLKKGQAHELNLGDIVTLWRFHQNEVRTVVIAAMEGGSRQVY